MRASAVATGGSWRQHHRAPNRMGGVRPRKRGGSGTVRVAAHSIMGKDDNRKKNDDERDLSASKKAEEGDATLPPPITAGSAENNKQQRRRRGRRGRGRTENHSGVKGEEKEKEKEEEAAAASSVEESKVIDTPLHLQNKETAASNEPSSSSSSKKPPKPPPPHRPNYFVSARMKLSPEAVQKVEEIHAKLTDLAPELRTAAVGASSAHVTLNVFHLADESEVEAAAAALRSLADTPEMSAGGPLRATLETLGHFRHQVLFVGMRDDGQRVRLATLAAASRSAMVEAGVMDDCGGGGGGGGAEGFTPHVTLAKTSKVKWKKPPPRGGGKDRGKENHGDDGVKEEQGQEDAVAVGSGGGVGGGGDKDVEDAEATTNSGTGVAATDDVTAAETGGAVREDSPPPQTQEFSSSLSPKPPPKPPPTHAVPRSDPTDAQKRRTSVRKTRIPTAELLEAFSEVHLGVVEVTQLELCSMMAPKDDQGYYAVCAAVSFATSSVSAASHYFSSSSGDSPS